MDRIINPLYTFIFLLTSTATSQQIESDKNTEELRYCAGDTFIFSFAAQVPRSFIKTVRVIFNNGTHNTTHVYKSNGTLEKHHRVSYTEENIMYNNVSSLDNGLYTYIVTLTNGSSSHVNLNLKVGEESKDPWAITPENPLHVCVGESVTLNWELKERNSALNFRIENKRTVNVVPYLWWEESAIKRIHRGAIFDEENGLTIRNISSSDTGTYKISVSLRNGCSIDSETRVILRQVCQDERINAEPPSRESVNVIGVTGFPVRPIDSAIAVVVSISLLMIIGLLPVILVFVCFVHRKGNSTHRHAKSLACASNAESSTLVPNSRGNNTDDEDDEDNDDNDQQRYD